MLGPHFKEGHTLAATSSIELPLPEDDPEAMLTLCRVLHFHNKETVLLFDVNHILGVAVLADKYDCTEAMMPSVACWVYENLKLDTIHKTERQTLLLAAHYVKSTRLYATIGHELVMKSFGPIHGPGQSLNKQLPETVTNVLSKYYYLGLMCLADEIKMFSKSRGRIPLTRQQL